MVPSGKRMRPLDKSKQKSRLTLAGEGGFSASYFNNITTQIIVKKTMVKKSYFDIRHHTPFGAEFQPPTVVTDSTKFIISIS